MWLLLQMAMTDCILLDTGLLEIVKIYLGLSLVLLWVVWGQFVFG